ncbi:DUF4465 domain-containing protein, partial [bacterium]|nr:DUF4465 domain-containing protein [bacterium]
MNKLITVFLSLFLCYTAFAQNETHKVYSTFDNLALPKLDTFDNGADGKEYIEHYGRKFHQSYDTQWGSWSGWALSNYTDNENGGYTNQYSSMTASGLSRTSNYMVGFDNATISMDSAQEISGAYFTNSAYAYYDMKNGSNFSKKFGGDNGTDPDYLRLKLYWYLKGVFQDSSTFYLADFTASDSEDDYILDDWFYWDFNDTLDQDILTDSLVFKFESTDTSQWGINTPTYFCMDDFNALSSFGNSWYYSMLSNIENDSIYVGEDISGGFNEAQLFFPNNYNADWNSWSGFAVSKRFDTLSTGFTNQYSPMAYDNPGAVIINYGQLNEIRSPYFDYDRNTVHKLQAPPPWPVKLRVTNTAYGYYDMLNGSNFSKKFGGVDGSEPDYFRLIARYI